MITEVFRRLTERYSPGDAFGEKGVHWVFQNSDGHPPLFAAGIPMDLRGRGTFYNLIYQSN
jgi:hypothetical protein